MEEALPTQVDSSLDGCVLGKLMAMESTHWLPGHLLHELEEQVSQTTRRIGFRKDFIISSQALV